MAFKFTILPFLFIFFFLFSLSNGKFSNESLKKLQGCRKGSKVQGLNVLKLYLARYGYLNNQNNVNGVNSENDEFDDELEAALISYQNFFQLNSTGTLDEPTVSQMLVPRCGCPDKKIPHHQDGPKGLHTVSHYAFFQGDLRWSVSDLTYEFLNNYPDEGIPPVVRAFNSWTSGSNYFTFSSASSANLKISFETQDHGDGDPFRSPTTLAHSFAPTDGRLHFNGAEMWSPGPGAVPEGAVDLESVALHEIGHLLGLAHSNDPNAVMYPTLDEGSIKRSLTPDDIQGIKALYGLN
ncbi:metalloendoproteinase 3-MMP-like [Rutidosis leptorrhynchoides]|uniref:metalloendoproteinase 3-MMP-like n=1 Tax=Rutidosis leptorrhynchoides TaxID=125765 RepID=UPI003A995D4E